MTSPTSLQAPRAVVMIRPHAFRVNPQTAADNAFQSLVAATDADLAASAFEEVSAAADRLQAEGVRVHLFDDDGRHDTPDSVFPNNWFSTHVGGQIAVYPMAMPSRRRERRSDVIELLKTEYRVQDVIDYSGLAHDGVFLEGTGAMVLDHIGRIAYTARSNRADPVALERFCTHFNFEPMVFDSADRHGRPVYHTNVLMCIATRFALVGLDLMTDARRRAEICQRLEDGGREVIALSPAQIAEFAGNAIELGTPHGRLLALSTRAAAALTAKQCAVIERTARLVALPVPTIEQAGGSVRCMIAGIHLTRR
ncbi:MAG TPA: arginine deiminase-related protein [Ideonella sp.]|uniref:citrulline utilization hydrolase CtlX n=1 Tax=Ideonella sp. TaxID=1929293 RepID=UPI002E3528C1|nr:arginine deiminase-related protein [Ideonella sp.]HEX5686420.1 arginine deiminase-related protein [Ideonella sp.]